MSGFMAFWLLLAAVFVLSGRGRARGRSRGRWGMDPRAAGERCAPRWEERQRAEALPGEREAYVEELETRVARLEERLDFTEKLIMERPGKSD